MSVIETAASILKLIDGLTLEERRQVQAIIRPALSGKPAAKTGAERQAKYRGRDEKAVTQNVTRDVTSDEKSDAVGDAFSPPSPSLHSPSLSPSGSLTKLPESESPESDPTCQVSTGKENLREQEYQRAYELGIQAGKKSPYAMPEAQRGALHQALATFGVSITGKKLRGALLLAWIQGSAKAFALWLSRRPDEASYWSSYGPRGWLRWLNEKPAGELLGAPAAAQQANREFDQRYPQNGTGPPADLFAELTKNIGKGGSP